MKAYYHLNVGILCGVCGWACHPDAERNTIEEPSGPTPTHWYCVNERCPQLDVVFGVQPFEVEVK